VQEFRTSRYRSNGRKFRMLNKVVLCFVGVEFFFALSGGLLLAFPLVMNNASTELREGENIARNILLSRFPMKGA
jgi:hypothetical protein